MDLLDYEAFLRFPIKALSKQNLLAPDRSIRLAVDARWSSQFLFKLRLPKIAYCWWETDVSVWLAEFQSVILSSWYSGDILRSRTEKISCPIWEWNLAYFLLGIPYNRQELSWYVNSRHFYRAKPIPFFINKNFRRGDELEISEACMFHCFLDGFRQKFI